MERSKFHHVRHYTACTRGGYSSRDVFAAITASSALIRLNTKPQLLDLCPAFELCKNNIGSTATQYETYLFFENWVDKKVTEGGNSARMGNDPYHTLNWTGTAEGPDEDNLLQAWDRTSDPRTAIDQGCSILNASIVPPYHDLGKDYHAQDFMEDRAPTLQFGGADGWSVKVQGPGLPGALFEIWRDPPVLDQTTVHQNTRISAREFAQNRRGSPKPLPAYAQFDSLAFALGRKPGFGAT
jgi:hypothetical protein